MEDTNDTWIVIWYWPYEPSRVYGPFDSESKALNWAINARLTDEGNGSSIEVTSIRNIKEV